MSVSKIVSFSLPVSRTELRLDITLQCGQAFRWRVNADGHWHGMIGLGLWSLYQDDKSLYCTLHNPSSVSGGKHQGDDSTCLELNKIKKEPSIVNKRKLCGTDNKSRKKKKPSTNNEPIQTSHQVTPCNEEKLEQYLNIIKSYFRLDICLESLYTEWSQRDSNFRNVCKNFPGVRMLDQPPVENVFSFICSSNNNITRISQLVEKLCIEFGEPAGELDGKTWHSFPNVEALSKHSVEETLRKLGFGYRASYIANSAKLICDRGGASWLNSLKDIPYEDCRTELCSLPGIGPKVSDCISLMSMGHLEAIPVDTHVHQIALRDYNLAGLKPGAKSLTSKAYKIVTQHFQELYGPYAGWAHSVLFSADLKKLSTVAKKR